MIEIDRVYTTVKTLANTDMRGNAKPDEIRLMINTAVGEIVGEYFAELNRHLFKENAGRINNGIENMPDRMREKLLYFLTSSNKNKNVNGNFDIPADLLYTDVIISSTISSNSLIKPFETTFEECKSRNEFEIIKNNNASVDYPIYIQLNGEIKVAPGVFESINIYYLRKHKIAKWTFTVINGNEVFNSSAPDFQNIDLHPSEESNVVIRTLQKLGINLKERDITAIASQIEQTDFNKQNA